MKILAISLTQSQRVAMSTRNSMRPKPSWIVVFEAKGSDQLQPLVPAATGHSRELRENPSFGFASINENISY